MNVARTVTWFAGFVLVWMAFRYFPSWREVAVFCVTYVVCVAGNMWVGWSLFAKALKDGLNDEAGK